MIMTSQEVIQAFLCGLRLKQDVVPAAIRHLFRATTAGPYPLFVPVNAELKQSGMVGWVTVMEPRDYEAWMRGGAANRLWP